MVLTYWQTIISHFTDGQTARQNSHGNTVYCITCSHTVIIKNRGKLHYLRVDNTLYIDDSDNARSTSWWIRRSTSLPTGTSSTTNTSSTTVWLVAARQTICHCFTKHRKSFGKCLQPTHQHLHCSNKAYKSFKHKYMQHKNCHDNVTN